MLHAIFFLAAIVLGFASITFVTQVTLGVWMVGAACLVAICSRMCQADDHHAKVMEALKELRAADDDLPDYGPSGEAA